jgi:hypothetical protein
MYYSLLNFNPCLPVGSNISRILQIFLKEAAFEKSINQ